jgi:hypothetical protein
MDHGAHDCCGRGSYLEANPTSNHTSWSNRHQSPWDSSAEVWLTAVIRHFARELANKLYIARPEGVHSMCSRTRSRDNIVRLNVPSTARIATLVSAVNANCIAVELFTFTQSTVFL